MKIHEFQAKTILAEYGVPVPQGDVALTPAEARNAAERLGGVVVIKAQIHAGGRGKAGGIVLASSPGEAETAAERLIGSRLVPHPTGPGGSGGTRGLVEGRASIPR